jgi:hypothetical protein
VRWVRKRATIETTARIASADLSPAIRAVHGRVAVDVSGQAFVDLEREATVLMLRQ